MKSIKMLLVALFTLASANAFAQSQIVADVIYSGGLPMPNGPASWGSTVYSDGKVVFYENYADRTVVKVGAVITTAQLNKLVKAGADLVETPLTRDANAPKCMDAPYIRYFLVNKAGESILIRDSLNCVEGNRADFAGYTEALFLKSLDHVVSFGFY